MDRAEILAQLADERATLELYATAEVRRQVIERRIDPLLEELAACEANRTADNERQPA